MKTILCNDCGETMTRFVNQCRACTRTNLSFYDMHDAPELQAKIKELRGGVDGLTRVMYASLILSVFAVVIYGYSQSMSVKMAQLDKVDKPVKTAATSSSVSQ